MEQQGSLFLPPAPSCPPWPPPLADLSFAQLMSKICGVFHGPNKELKFLVVEHDISGIFIKLFSKKCLHQGY
ncbi:unnamed protein product [Urochloa humidicola]